MHHSKLSIHPHRPKPRTLILRKSSIDDEVPYSEKYKDSRSAQYTLNSLENMLHANENLTNEQFADLIYDKWRKYYKAEIREYYGKIHLVLNHSSYVHKFIALANYDKIVKRLNALHVSYHIYNIINEVDFPDAKRPLIISLGISSYSDDPREEEWRL